jgi:hypothetical protein
MFTLKLQDKSPVCELDGTTISVFSEKTAKEGETHLAHTVGDLQAGGNLNWPGEYDRAGTSIRGLSADDTTIMWRLDIDNAKCAFMKTPLADALSDHHLERLGEIDVLVIESDDAKKAEKTIEALDPRIIVVIGNGNAELLKALTNTVPEAVKSYTVKSSMPAEGREIVILTS